MAAFARPGEEIPRVGEPEAGSKGVGRGRRDRVSATGRKEKEDKPRSRRNRLDD